MKKTGKAVVILTARKSRNERKKENEAIGKEKERLWCQYTNAISVEKNGEQ